MKRKYGVDYDGTIANTHQLRADWININSAINKELKEKVINSLKRDLVYPWETDRSSLIKIIGDSSYEEMKKDTSGEEWSLKAQPINGAIAGLHALSSSGDVYIITTRFHQRKVYAEKWLKNHDALEYIKDMRTTYELDDSETTKASICQELEINVLIDNDERHLVEIMTNFQLNKILFKDGMPRENMVVPPGIKLATSWQSVLSILDLQ